MTVSMKQGFETILYNPKTTSITLLVDSHQLVSSWNLVETDYFVKSLQSQCPKLFFFHRKRKCIFQPFCLYLKMTRCRKRELRRRTGSGRLTPAILAKNIGKIYNIAPVRGLRRLFIPSNRVGAQFHHLSPKQTKGSLWSGFARPGTVRKRLGKGPISGSFCSFE